MHPQETETAATTQQSAFRPHSAATGTTVENEIGADRASPTPENSEEVPHARGPPVVGVEDMGLQDGKDVEMTLPKVESGSEGQPVVQDGQNLKHGEQAEGKAEADSDGDILLGDVKDGGEDEETGSAPDGRKSAEQGAELKRG